MEDLRSAKREGPSPSEACQIRRGREKKKNSNRCYWDSLEPQQTQERFVVYVCVCLCVRILIKQRELRRGCVVFKLFSS